MWNHRQHQIDQKTVLTEIRDDDRPLSMSEVVNLWIDDDSFRSFYNKLLADSAFESFFWEHPPMTTDTLEQAYEFVLVESSLLTRVQPDPHTFSQYFKKDEPVTVFPNLGGDATLIAPCPEVRHEIYTDLAPFVREAPDKQIEAFWQSVGSNFMQSIEDQPKWLSTAGMGVYWLHVRIDTIPKYYRHTEYKSADN